MPQEIRPATNFKEQLQEELTFINKRIADTVKFTLVATGFAIYLGHYADASYYLTIPPILGLGIGRLKRQLSERAEFIETSGLNSTWED